MTGERGHGIDVQTDSILAALIPTRSSRQALDALWGNIPPGILTSAVQAAFVEIDGKLREAELADLRRYGHPCDYVIVSPLNPMNPPAPDDMEKLAAALRILHDLGLIITL